MIEALNSDDEYGVFSVAQKFRKILSEHNPPIAELIQANIVPRFVQLLQTNNPRLQFEVAWVVTNITSGSPDQVRVVVDNGAVPVLVDLLGSADVDVREQAVRVLGNITADSPGLRDLVLGSGGLTAIIELIDSTTDNQKLRSPTRTLSNLCRSKSKSLTPALPTLVNLLQSTDTEVLADASWAFAYLSDGANYRIAAVLQAGAVKRLVELLGHACVLVQTPAFRAVGNIVTGDDFQTQAVMDAGVLKAFRGLISNPMASIRWECCRVISNIAAGNSAQTQEVINAGFIPEIVNLLRSDAFDIQHEAAWVISNAASSGNAAQIEHLIACGSIEPLIDFLAASGICRCLHHSLLEAFAKMLKIGKKKQLEHNLTKNPILLLIDQGGRQKLSALQDDGNLELSYKASLQRYFPVEGDDDAGDMQGTAPSLSSKGSGEVSSERWKCSGKGSGKGWKGWGKGKGDTQGTFVNKIGKEKQRENQCLTNCVKFLRKCLMSVKEAA